MTTTKPEVRGISGCRAVFMADARITEWTDGDPFAAPLVQWLARLLLDARAEGMGEALEIAKKHAQACVGADHYVGFDEVDTAIAERQAALRGDK